MIVAACFTVQRLLGLENNRHKRLSDGLQSGTEMKISQVQLSSVTHHLHVTETVFTAAIRFHCAALAGPKLMSSCMPLYFAG